MTDLVHQVGERTIRPIPIDLIAPHPDNGRELVADEAMRDLADRIKAEGQLQAAEIAPTTPELAARGVDRQFVLVFGHRRWFACQLAGLTTLECQIRSLTTEEIFRRQISENLEREDLTPIAEARKIALLIAPPEEGGFGLGQRGAAAFIGKGQSFVAKRLALLKLPQEVQQRVSAGQLSRAAAYELSKLSEYPDRIRELADDVSGKDELLVRDAVDHVLEAEREKQAEAEQRAKVGRPRSTVQTDRQAVIRRRYAFVPWEQRPNVNVTAKIPGQVYARARKQWGRRINDEITSHVIAWLEQELVDDKDEEVG